MVRKDDCGHGTCGPLRLLVLAFHFSCPSGADAEILEFESLHLLIGASGRADDEAATLAALSRLNVDGMHPLTLVVPAPCTPPNQGTCPGMVKWQVRWLA